MFEPNEQQALIHKTIAGRPRDLEDLRKVLLKNRSFDIEYVRRWLRQFDRSLSGDALARFEAEREAANP